MIEAIKDFWFWHKENLLLTVLAAALFGVVYEVAVHYTRKFLNK